eukprot:CAMPEP_0205860442 /NCGR_PEP_ID=MMETSP1083-20121108/5239_1 /ASSEMBLY_ACC=CAM_ASM_000430 /TAXON_ID=97485 /ORGANISM="Prymnesium parvum, Strain Texoma1" /LENGTH=70 /DNA_ID=CAMNT_0053222081 /DNA_START=832 /DNA_END=1044 /DNA_ORIENTATION=-
MYSQAARRVASADELERAVVRPGALQPLADRISSHHTSIRAREQPWWRLVVCRRVLLVPRPRKAVSTALA